MRPSRVVLLITVIVAVGVFVWVLLVPWDIAGNKVATVAATEAGIVAAGGAFWVFLRQQEHTSNRPSRRDAREAIEAVVERISTESIAVQLEKLTDLGTMTVPWRVISGATGSLRKSRRIAEKYSIEALVEVLDLNSTRMLIVGGSDSGKTTALHRLAAAALLVRKDTGGAVPIVLSLASWRPLQHGFETWATQELARLHPELDASGRLGDVDRAIRSGKVVPFLDGFDEIEPGFQADALATVRAWSRERPFVVTSRYLYRGREIPPLLTTGAVVAMEDLPLSEASNYLKANDDDGRHLWQTTITEIRSGTAGIGLAESLTSPLMVWLAGTVFAPSLGDNTGAARMAELSGLAARDDVEDRLLESLVPAVFRRSTRSEDAGRLHVDYCQAEHWLGFLATKLRREGGRLSFWTLTDIAPIHRLGLVTAAIAGILLGALCDLSAMASFSLLAGYVLGLCFGFSFGRGYSESRSRGLGDPYRVAYGGRTPGADPDFLTHLRKFLFGLALTPIIVAFLAGTVYVTTLTRPIWRQGMSAPVILLGLSAAVVVTSAAGAIGAAVAAVVLRSTAALAAGTGAQARTPATAVANDRRSGVGMICLSWAFITMLTGLGLYLAPRQPVVFAPLIGLGATLPATSIFNVWINYKVAHVWLVLVGRLPWQLGDFLDQAHHNGVLRQNGTAYEFRHLRLRAALASSYPNRRQGGKRSE